MLLRAAALFLFAAVAVAAAQPAAPPSESVTVTGERERAEQIKRFVESFAAPTQLLGKLSRWDTGICPVAVGLRPAAVQFILKRLRDNAKLVGAPVAGRPDCKPNIEIVFTTTPQGLLDNVRKDHVIYLGYASNGSQADRLAMVLHPIQAWYTTATKGITAIPKIDSARTVGLGDPDDFAMAIGGGGNVTGFRMHDGRTSTLYHVIIAVDPARLADHEIGGVADYISFLALSPVASLDRCQQLASVMNMLVPGCAAAAGEMTPNDVAFLRGLYQMTLDGTLGLQKDGISHVMKQEGGP